MIDKQRIEEIKDRAESAPKSASADIMHLLELVESQERELAARRNILEANVEQMMAAMPWMKDNSWYTPGHAMRAEIDRLRKKLGDHIWTGHGYHPNTTTWKKGDLVFAESDAKEVHMLMRVIGYTRDGLCKTKYLYPDRVKHGGKRTWKNEIMFLLDPEQFGINVAAIKKGLAA